MIAGLWLIAVSAIGAAPLPWPGLAQVRARDLDCERLDIDAAVRRYPGLVAAPHPKGELRATDVLRCEQRLLRAGLRPTGIEALLSTLQDRVADAARGARSEAPELTQRTWLVSAHLGSPAVGAKVRFAAQNALMAEGLAVSDRAPMWSAGDVRALSDLPGDQVMAAACARMHALEQLGPDEALLGLTQVSSRETGLHAGVCADGTWRWLR